jgi:hypothetical protein
MLKLTSILSAFILLLFILLLLWPSHKETPGGIVYAESYRKKGMPDEKIIQAAINAAGEGGTVQLQGNRVYTIGNVILIKKFQTLLGNNTTLIRANQSFTSLARTASYDQPVLHLSSLPPDWAPGDQIQLLTDSTAAHSNAFADLPRLPNIITSISGDSILLSSPVGSSLDGTITEWPAGAKVRKVFDILRGDSINMASVPFHVQNLNFDGNKKNNDLNYYWNVNATLFTRGAGAKIEDCKFFNIPNENIVGQGIYVTDCQAYNLNGSFVHLSGIDTIHTWPQKNSFIMGNYVDGVCLIPTSVTRHSEGAFTTSFTGGFATIIGNRVYHCGEAAIGLIEYHTDTADGGKSDFVITDNLFKDCQRIIYDIRSVPGNAHASSNIIISDNVFSNCGSNDWSKYTFLKEYTGLKVRYNDLTDGTEWILPGRGRRTFSLSVKKYTPASSSEKTGKTGDVYWDESFMYIKTTKGWKRQKLSYF